MLYIPNNRQIELKIPRLSQKYDSAEVIQLKSTIDLTVTNVAVEVAEVSALYITIGAVIPNMQGGEYQYALMEGDNIVSSGLAIVAEIENDYTEYEQEEEYIQYNAE